MKYIITIYIAFFLVFFCQAQKEDFAYYAFKQLTSENGLSQSAISAIIQDSDGFMWFGSFNGINRYDGYNIKVYKYNNDSSVLNSNFILELFLDSKNNLWAGSNNGVGLYSKLYDKFLDLNYIANSNYDLQQVEDILEDEFGMIWFATTSGLYKYNISLNKLEQITPKNIDNFPYLKITNIELSVNGDFYITALEGLYLLSSRTLDISKVGVFESKNNSNGNDKEYSITMGTDSMNNLWLGTSLGSIYKYNTSTDFFEKINFPNASIVSKVFPESDSTILIGLDINGLYRYNIKNNKYQKIVNSTDPSGRIGNGKAVSIYIDKQKMLWVGHFQAGISYASTEALGFKVVDYSIIQDKKIVISAASSILKDSKGFLWLGTDGGGIIRYNPEMTDYEIFKNNPSNKQSLPHDAVLKIFEDSKKQIWIGSFRGALAKFDEKTKTFSSIKHIENTKNSLGFFDVRDIVEDSLGNLWLMSHGSGITFFNPEKEQFENYRLHEDGTNSLVNNWTFDIGYDKKGNLWIATSKGISRFDIKNKLFHNYIVDIDNPDSLQNDFVICMFSDSKGRLWFGTDKGLVEYNFEQDAFKETPKNSIISKESIYSIQEDTDGNLWISSTNGLFSYNPDNEFFKRFSVTDGLQANEFIRNSSFKDKDGVLYFGGIKGFNYFNPKDININRTIPGVEIIQIDVMGKPLASNLLPVFNKFPFDKNFLSFSFVALNFISTEKNEFKYKLEGLDIDWHNAGTERKAVYTSLPYGKYTFRVIACNNDGVWNEIGKSFSFEISPPWYATWLFRILLAFFIFGSFVAFYLYKTKNIKQQKTILEHNVKQRTQELKEANQFLENKNIEIELRNTILNEKQLKIEQQTQALIAQKEEIVAMNENLHELVTTKDKMLSIIAHDLKNPMGAVIGLTELILGKVKDTPVDKIEKFISLINQSTINAHTLLENLLTWARAQTGNIKLEIQNQQLNKIIDQNVSLLTESAFKKNITLQICYTEKIDYFVNIDFNTVSTIVRNIISNAIKIHSGRWYHYCKC
ncbi:MAG: hypothetical protein IPO21_10015 [Bacteroidales bacterium]|nr:hypothetical protein [Bacteroidales bacterium]